MRIFGRLGGSVCVAALPNSPRFVTVDTVPATQESVSRKAEAASRLRRSSFRRSSTSVKSSKWPLLSLMTNSKTRRPGQTPHRHDKKVNYSAAIVACSEELKPATPPGTSPSTSNMHYLHSIVDGDQGRNSRKFQDYHRDVYRRGYALSNGPKLVVSEHIGDTQFPSQNDISGNNEGTLKLISRLHAAISLRLLHPDRISLETIYKLYCQLPKYRMLYMTWHWRDKLLRIMGLAKNRNIHSMLRYSVLMEDIRKCGLTIRHVQWNFALAFAAKNASRSTTRALELTLRAWKEMESGARIPGNGVTFNILFDVATKAGNFTLAEMIYREMENRGIEYNRYHHVSLIHYFGLKLDSEGIRAAFWDMVESGEEVNTVVLNCVISGLLRCGEDDSAERTYRQMKGYSLCPGPPKNITTAIKSSSRVGRRHDDLTNAVEAELHIKPNLHTFKLLIKHYAIALGNITKVAQFLEEMRCLDVSMHPSIFMILFKGFYLHGGFQGSDWSETKLEGVLSSLCEARNTYGKGFRIDCWLVIWALRAFKKCSTTDSLETVFHVLIEHWDVPEDRHKFMHEIYQDILQDRNKSSEPMRHRRDGTWI